MRRFCFLAFVFLSLVLVSGLASCSTPKAASGQPREASVATRTGDEVVRPFKKNNGKPFRIAVVQSGDYFAYNDVLVSIRDGLAELGWVGKIDLSPEVRANVPRILQAWNLGQENITFPPSPSSTSTGPRIPTLPQP